MCFYVECCSHNFRAEHYRLYVFHAALFGNAFSNAVGNAFGNAFGNAVGNA